MHIILDPGHGGIIDSIYQTSGKQFHHPNGKSIYEGDFNRKVVAMVSLLCDTAGISNEILVPELTDVSLSRRAKRANAIYKKRLDSVLISIHANAGKGTGYEVYTSVGETKSDPLSELMIEAMGQGLLELRLRPDNTDGDRDKEAQFYILRKTWCPAMLVECAFMDTYEPDCRMMLENPNQFAKAIFRGIEKMVERCA